MASSVGFVDPVSLILPSFMTIAPVQRQASPCWARMTKQQAQKAFSFKAIDERAVALSILQLVFAEMLHQVYPCQTL